MGQGVSAERGQLITPVFMFPKTRFHDSMLTGAPVRTVGFANSPTSDWMTGPLFLKVLQHIKQTTKIDKILKLLDNHENHCTIDAIKFAMKTA